MTRLYSLYPSNPLVMPWVGRSLRTIYLSGGHLRPLQTTNYSLGRRGRSQMQPRINPARKSALPAPIGITSQHCLLAQQFYALPARPLTFVQDSVLAQSGQRVLQQLTN